MTHLDDKKRNIICAALCALSAGLIGVGIYLGEPSVVLHKAASICMQCIGLG